MPIQKWSDEILLVQLANEPALSEDLTALGHEVSRGGDGRTDAVIDFSGITQLNSSNMSQLLRLRKEAGDRQSRIKLAALPDSIWVVFLTTGLDKLFDFAPDVPTALAGLQLDEK